MIDCLLQFYAKGSNFPGINTKSFTTVGVGDSLALGQILQGKKERTVGDDLEYTVQADEVSIIEAPECLTVGRRAFYRFKR